MTRVLFEHVPGCTPMKPCLSCQVATYLRGALRLGQYNHLLKMIHPPPEIPEDQKIPLIASIEDLHLSSRTRNALKKEHIRTVHELIRTPSEALLRMPNFGAKSLAEIEEALMTRGRRLGEPINATLADFYRGHTDDGPSVP